MSWRSQIFVTLFVRSALFISKGHLMTTEILEVIDFVVTVDLDVDLTVAIELALKAAAVGLTALKLYLDEKSRKRSA